MERRYKLTMQDQLTTIAPITDVIQVPNVDNDLELVVLSGYHNMSYLTFLKVIIKFNYK